MNNQLQADFEQNIQLKYIIVKKEGYVTPDKLLAHV